MLLLVEYFAKSGCDDESNENVGSDKTFWGFINFCALKGKK